MEKEKKTEELRGKLDKSLNSPDLINPKSLRSLVKNHLVCSGTEGNIDRIVDKRTNEVSKFLEMLRSASENEEGSTNNWKLKQDTEQLRVLYREGPHGTPFHTLLAEGFANGPVDVCLCVSWETTLYKKWWPQYNFPTFKITASDLLKIIRVGEEISLMRVKVPWPVSDREALLHYFEIEFVQEDLVLVLLKTISDEESIDINTDGFNRDGIPKANGTVQMDIIGGFVLQKLNDQKSYFRAIANMDIKLDFVPPSLINFVARQLIGNGHKLYQKAIGTVATSDEEYKKALKNALYVRIRNSMSTTNKQDISQYSISTGTNGTSISEIEELEEEEEEWYDAHDEINDDQMKNDTIISDHMKNELQLDSKCSAEKARKELDGAEKTCLIPDVTLSLTISDGAINKVRVNGPSWKAQFSHAFQRKFVSFNTVSEASNSSVCANEDLVASSNLLNACHHELTSSRDLRQNENRSCAFSKEKNGKVGDEGAMKKNGFNDKNSNKRKNKNNKWNCCTGESAVMD